jgi:serine/threonine protein kinase
MMMMMMMMMMLLLLLLLLLFLDCKDLIKKLLVKEEKQRLTISAVRQHSWVNIGYLRPPPSFLRDSEYATPVSSINEEVMQHLVELGFSDTPDTRKEILLGRKTQIVATYHALLNRLTQSSSTVSVPSPIKRSPSPQKSYYSPETTRKRSNSIDTA